MKKIWCLLIAMFLMTGCASKVEEESHFITDSIENAENNGYVIIKEHENDQPMVSQTLCTGIQGVSSVRAHNPYSKVIVDYEDGNQKEFTFEDEATTISIEYITKTESASTPCIITSEYCVYVYDAETADFQRIADDFLFYLENYQNKYYYVNTEHELVDTEGNVYCTNVVGVKADSNRNNTTVYVDN